MNNYQDINYLKIKIVTTFQFDSVKKIIYIVRV